MAGGTANFRDIFKEEMTELTNRAWELKEMATAIGLLARGAD